MKGILTFKFKHKKPLLVELLENKDKEIEILNKENKLLQDMDKILRNENVNLKLRINKTIEYIDLIRNSMCISEDYVLTNVLEILKGEDNDNMQ